MSSLISKKEELQDSMDDEECLKIRYQGGSLEPFEVPIYENGTVSFTDISVMDSKIYALILQREDGYRRLIKPKHGYWKEPPEKWDIFKVYGALKEQPEAVLNVKAPNENLNLTAEAAVDLDKNEVLNNIHESQHPSTSSSILNIRINDSNIEIPIQPENLQSRRSNASSNVSSIDYGNTLQDAATASINEHVSDDESLTEFSVTACDEPEIDDDFNCIKAMNEPADYKLFVAYKVYSLAELKCILCRGNPEYNSTVVKLFKHFKRTMVTYPNKESARLLDWARTCNVSLKSLNSSAKDFCELCKEPMDIKHLLAKRHVIKYHKKFNADPPEIAKLLEPKYYEKFIDPTVLAGL